MREALALAFGLGPLLAGIAVVIVSHIVRRRRRRWLASWHGRRAVAIALGLDPFFEPIASPALDSNRGESNAS